MWTTTSSVMVKGEAANNFPIPLAAFCTPFSDGADSSALALADHQGNDPTRCPRCRSYANPFFKWCQRNTGRLQCNMCMHTFEVPEPVLQNMSRAEQRPDEQNHLELVYGSVDHVATSDLDGDRPAAVQAPAVIFLLEASASAVSSGFFDAALGSLADFLDSSDCALRRRVCLMTFGEALHFFVPSRQGRFRKMSVVRPGDPFLPASAPTLFFDIEPEQARNDFVDFLQLLRETEANSSRGASLARCSCAGDAMRAAIEALTAVGGGDLMVMQATCPSLGLGAPIQPTLPEKTSVPQQPQFYKDTLALCVEGGVAVNVVTAPAGVVQVDVETLQWLAWRTGGDVLHLPAFTPTAQSTEQLTQHLHHWAGKMQGSAYGCVVKFRCSKGLKCTELLAPWRAAAGSQDCSAFELPRLSADASFMFTVKPDVCGEEEDIGYRSDKPKYMYLQTAVLYTNVRGERLLRVHTCAVAIATTGRAVFQSVSIGPLTALVVKRAAALALEAKPDAKRAPRDAMLTFLLEAVGAYQKQFHVENSERALVINRRMSLLPLYVLGARKLFYYIQNAGPSGNELLQRILRMPIHSILAMLYPRVYPVEKEEDISAYEGDTTVSTIAPMGSLPTPIAPMQESIVKGTWPAYVVSNGLGAWVYINQTSKGAGSPRGNCGESAAAEEKTMKTAAEALCTQLRDALEPSPLAMPLREITNLSTTHETGKDQKVFLAMLFIEDEGFTEMSYPDWVQFLVDQLRRRVPE